MQLFHAAATFLVLVVGTFPSSASAQVPACVLPLATVEARIREAVPASAFEFERHAGPEVSAIVERLNAEPPVTDFVADSMLIAYLLGQPGAVVVLGLDGCVAGQITLPVMQARTLFGLML